MDSGSPGDDDSRSARSESHYTDADSVASDAFESGAEDISDDEGVTRPRASGSSSADALARDMRAGVRFDSDTFAFSSEGIASGIRAGGSGDDVGRRGDDERRDRDDTTRYRDDDATRDGDDDDTRDVSDFSEAEVREAFAAFDEDGDGFLTAEDVQSFFDALGETLTIHETAELVRLVDHDEDGLVNFEEFFDLATRSAAFVSA